MNIIDLQPFCGKDHDLRSPMRCDGVGEFKRGSHWYICENCNGNGKVNSKQPFHGSSQDICTACDGTGERSQLVLVSNCKLSNHDLSRLQALPECRIGVKSPTDTVAVTFNGGFGAVMPRA